MLITDQYETDLSIQTVGHEICAPDKRPIDIVRKCYVLHFVTRGKGQLKIGRMTYDIAEKTIFFSPAEVRTSYTSSSSEPWEYYWIEFSGYFAKQLCTMINLSEKSPLLTYRSDKILEYLVSIDSIEQNDPSANFKSMSMLYGIMAVLLDELSEPTKRSKKREDKEFHIAKAIRYIHQFYGSASLDLHAIAGHLCLNPAYLSKLFHESTGIPFKDYLNDIRMKNARMLLLTTKLPVREIANRCGFSDALYFSKVYKKYYGKTPSFVKHEKLD